MKFLIGSCLVFLFSFVVIAFTSPNGVFAQTTPSYSVGTVKDVVEENRTVVEESEFYVQQLRVQLQDGTEVFITAGSEFQPLRHEQLLKSGQRVIIGTQQMADGGLEYVIADVYRLPTLLFLTAALFALVIWIGRTRGLAALLGMVLSLVVLVKGIVPALLAGNDPVLVAIVGSVFVAAFTIYLSHGWSLKSHMAFGSLVATLLAVLVLSVSSVHAAQLVGLGSEEAYFLQFGPAGQVNLQGLLLAGIMLGALGVLDDSIVSQISVVKELKAAQPKLKFEDLYWRGLEVGRDHVASLVNTLVLAYAGANLPLFLLFYLNTQSPIWVTLNSDVIAEEFMRTVIGSIGLVAAVPLTTVLAAFVFTKWGVGSEETAAAQRGVHRH